jgi:hypothetical protein
MSRVALYYPHWGIDDPRFMFDALLYWDRLACIVPYEEFRPSAHWRDGLQEEADLLHESFVTGIAPTDEVKDRVHDRLEALLATVPPEWCRAENLTPSRDAVMAVRKLSPRTIDMLIEHRWLAVQGDDLALISHAASGLLLSAIAGEIASNTMPAVTDEPATFKATCNGLLRELQSQQGIGISPTGDCYSLGSGVVDEEPELAIVLTKIAKLGIADEAIEPSAFRRLHKLRQDSGFNEQREQFRAQVDKYVSELRERPSIEHEVIHDHWEMELTKDREALKKELRAAGIDAIVEKEGVVATGLATLAGAGAVAAVGPLGLIIGVGIAGVAITDRLRRRRIEVREKRWTSWLTSASGQSRIAF